MNLDSDVIVIGAGPAGSRTAQRIAAAGYSVILIERRAELGNPVCCTGIISCEAFTRFEIDPVIAMRELKRATIYAPNGRSVQAQRDSPQAVIVDRGSLDGFLTTRAVESGAKLLLNTRAESIRTDDNRVIVSVASCERSYNLTARAAVIASGFTPALLRNLGLGRIKDAALGLQVEVDTPEPAEVQLFLGRRFAPGFFGWLAPISDRKAKLGLLTRTKADNSLDALADFLRCRGMIHQVTDDIQCRPIPFSTLPKTFTDRIMVVGDAAGQVKSTTGGGLSYGMTCADIAADTMTKALSRNKLDAAALQSYERAWKARLGWDLRLGRLAMHAFQRLSDRQIDRLIERCADKRVFDRMAADERLTFDRHGAALLSAGRSLWPALLSL
ncbi:geranylgeranyl reductase family protein [Dehalogenimonas alkenigignens]|uniref:Geranylgeranyl reductase family n=1 Tax=Dehalogenimonas alkenigignens TaxID=1217799 RepID=A0A0W0GJQ2_9CHLR|nr:NAD(P)/FAD-dependent oxidoreductase [Dehalogenimonas alkenigignens]KTB48789.1 geranylgeranyl reductase family [Dehalogenimonas alkenigignens]